MGVGGDRCVWWCVEGGGGGRVYGCRVGGGGWVGGM